MFCTNCGKNMPEGSAHCPYCGTPRMENQTPVGAAVGLVHQANPQKAFCVNCGTGLTPEAASCPNCGTVRHRPGEPLKQVITQEADNRATIALVAEIIGGYLGFLGLGHMYSGRVGLGVAILLGWFFVLGGSLLGAVGTGGLLGCVALPIYLSIPVVSGLQARNYVRSNDRQKLQTA